MAAWTLMNPPANRSRDNTRPGVLAPPMVDTTPVLSPEEMQKKNLQQPPLFLLISRSSLVSFELTNAITNEVIYKIRETGRGSFSNKPDYEIFRASAGDLFIGSIRIGKRGMDIKLPVTNKRFDDPEKYISNGNALLNWVQTHVDRQKGSDGAFVPSAPGQPASWCIELDCFKDGASGADESVCAVKLIDTIPNGRFEIWDKAACVDVGGDWDLLDEYVTVAYANMEKARRRVMGRGDPTNIGIAGISMGAGVIG